MTRRLSYDESCDRPRQIGYLEEGEYPMIPTRMPRVEDDAPLGVSFFRTFVGDDEQGELEGLTLPRTFFGRSEVSNASFRNTDLSESCLCWNDFSDVDFTDADLSGGDLRASVYRSVRFVRASLRNADLRRSSFDDCDFGDADMAGARVTHDRADGLGLSERQRGEIDWQAEDGEEPEGG